MSFDGNFLTFFPFSYISAKNNFSCLGFNIFYPASPIFYLEKIES